MKWGAEQIAGLADGLLARVAGGNRFMLGITGPPGAGKSTLADELRQACALDVAVLALDGFHMTNAQLDAAGLRHRKGAPDTFDVASFVATLASLRRREAVRAPVYDRDIHEPRPGAVSIDATVSLVIVEGNYLLLDTPPWPEARALLDEVWYLATPRDECMRRVRDRHIRGGAAPAAADRKIAINDVPNAVLVEALRDRADLIVK